MLGEPPREENHSAHGELPTRARLQQCRNPGNLTARLLDGIAFPTIVLNSSGFAPTSHPTAVFCDQVGPPVKPLENTLLALAEHVRDHGFPAEGPFAAATALLLRRSPQPPTSHPTSLRAPGEDTLDAAKRLVHTLDGEVLPIQGPPGSGKTFTGARAILDLVRRGRRVGVTAVSHKVIDNLLAEIAKAAAKEKVAVRLLHKNKGEAPPGIEYNNDTDQVLGAIGPGTVVGGTVWLWAGDRAAGTLDHLFIDEAGQMALAPALAASRAAKNLVLLADPQQLEQPQRGAHPEGADVAALVHLVGKERKTLADDRGLFLDATWRLHPSICAFTSEVYYEGRLKPAWAPSHRRISGARGDDPFDGAPSALIAAAPEQMRWATDRKWH